MGRSVDAGAAEMAGLGLIGAAGGEGAADVAKYAAEAPQTPAVFILRTKDKQAALRRMGEGRIAEESAYYRLVIPGGLLAEANGKVFLGRQGVVLG